MDSTGNRKETGDQHRFAGHGRRATGAFPRRQTVPLEPAGPLYFPLHEKLQEYANTYRKYADLLAERQLQIGIPTDGRTETIVQTANLPKLPAGFLSDRQVLEIMTERIFTIAKQVRSRVESTAKNGDEVTSNKFQALSYELDKQVWQFRVHMQ